MYETLSAQWYKSQWKQLKNYVLIDADCWMGGKEEEGGKVKTGWRGVKTGEGIGVEHHIPEIQS